MTETIKLLTGDFVLLDLGSANSAALFKPFPHLARAATLIEVDARPTNNSAREQFHRVISLKKAVAGTAGQRPFYSREFPECSSFLIPKAELVKAYGMERYFQTRNVINLECATVPELLAEQEIPRVDFFKTDLEGLDFEVLRSAPQIVEKALCVQSELRFQPIFEGEPYFHEVVSHLTEIGFEMISIQPQVWKYETPNRVFSRDGRVVWTDAFFFLSSERVRQRFPRDTWKAFAKQIVLSRMFGLTNFSEFLFTQTKNEFPQTVRAELESFAKPARTFPSLLTAGLVKFRLGRLMLEALRRSSAKVYLASAVFKDEVIGINRPV